jgi:hypothetical protein
MTRVISRASNRAAENSPLSRRPASWTETRGNGGIPDRRTRAGVAAWPLRWRSACRVLRGAFARIPAVPPRTHTPADSSRELRHNDPVVPHAARIISFASGSRHRGSEPGESEGTRLAIEAAIRLRPLAGQRPFAPGLLTPVPVAPVTPGGWINVVDPAYAVDPGPWRVPDPPHKPYPPRYFPARHISRHLAPAPPAGNTTEAAHPLARIATRGKTGGNDPR